MLTFVLLLPLEPKEIWDNDIYSPTRGTCGWDEAGTLGISVFQSIEDLSLVFFWPGHVKIDNTRVLLVDYFDFMFNLLKVKRDKEDGIKYFYSYEC